MKHIGHGVKNSPRTYTTDRGGKRGGVVVGDVVGGGVVCVFQNIKVQSGLAIPDLVDRMAGSWAGAPHQNWP